MDEISIDQAIAAVRLHELHQAGVITNLPPSIDVERCRRIVGLVARIKVHAARYHLSLKPQALDAALGCYRQALATRPEGITAHAQIAAILAEQGKWAEFEEALAQARRACPENLFPYYAAGTNLIAEGKHLDRAEPLLRVYLGQAPEGNMPDHAAVHWQLGLLFEKLGRKPDAVKELELAVRLRPKFLQAQKDLERLRKG